MAFEKVIGIYKIESKLKKHIYIGSSIDIKRRWRLHLSQLKNNKHHSIILQRHFNKYGLDDLEFSIIETCEVDDLIEAEQKHLDKNNAYFNIRKIAESNLGIKRSEETKEKLRQINLGKKLSEKTKKKMSDKMKGNKFTLGVPAVNRVRLICTESGMVFNSVMEASKYIDIKRTTLNAKISGQNPNNTTLIKI